MTYAEKLKDPRSQKKRLTILARDNFTCQNCNSDKNTLHVHHLKYTGEPWEAEDDNLVTLCEVCYEDERQNFKDATHDLLLMLKDNGWSSMWVRKLCQFVINLGTPPSYDLELFESLYNIIADGDAYRIAMEELERQENLIKQRTQNG